MSARTAPRERISDIGRQLDMTTALDMLRCIAKGGRTAVTLADEVGVSKPTVYRLLTRLQVLGVRVEATPAGLRVSSWGGLRKAWVVGRE